MPLTDETEKDAKCLDIALGYNTENGDRNCSERLRMDANICLIVSYGRNRAAQNVADGKADNKANAQQHTQDDAYSYNLVRLATL